jgi:multicomponent Na+:H+ antiporter subunit F
MTGIAIAAVPWIAAALVGCGVLVFIRFLLGPTHLDRLAAFESAALVGLCLVALYAIWNGSPWFFDLILVFSLVGFLSTVAVACFIEGWEDSDD